MVTGIKNFSRGGPESDSWSLRQVDFFWFVSLIIDLVQLQYNHGDDGGSLR